MISSDSPNKSVFGVSIPSSLTNGRLGSSNRGGGGDGADGDRRSKSSEQLRIGEDGLYEDWDDMGMEWMGKERSPLKGLIMNDTLSRWGAEGAPRTEVQAHAPGE